MHQALEKLRGKLVTGPDVLAMVEELADSYSAEAVTRAREIASEIQELDLRDAVAVEQRFADLPVGEYRAAGVVDRVDVTPSEGGGRRVLIVDYKTGLVQSRADLETAPQTILYLAWAARAHFPDGVGPGDDLAMVYEWPHAQIRVRVPYQEAAVARGLEAAARAWREYLAPGAREARAADASWCAHCAWRSDCPALEVEIDRPRSRPEWDDLDLPELVALRHQLHQDAAMLEGLRRDVDAEVLDQLESADLRKWSSEDHTASITSRAATRYDPAVLGELARLTERPLEGLVGEVATISSRKLTKLLAGLPEGETRDRAVRVVAHYASRTRGADYLLVRAKGGLF